jgi:hypothetical protein
MKTLGKESMGVCRLASHQKLVRIHVRPNMAIKRLMKAWYVSSNHSPRQIASNPIILPEMKVVKEPFFPRKCSLL